MRTNLKISEISSRIILEKENDEIFLIKDKKSRIVQKEGLYILELNRIINKIYGKNIILETTAPICSKTLKLLNENQIKIKQISHDGGKYGL